MLLRAMPWRPPCQPAKPLAPHWSGCDLRRSLQSPRLSTEPSSYVELRCPRPNALQSCKDPLSFAAEQCAWGWLHTTQRAVCAQRYESPKSPNGRRSADYAGWLRAAGHLIETNTTHRPPERAERSSLTGRAPPHSHSPNKNIHQDSNATDRRNRS